MTTLIIALLLASDGGAETLEAKLRSLPVLPWGSKVDLALKRWPRLRHLLTPEGDDPNSYQHAVDYVLGDVRITEMTLTYQGGDLRTISFGYVAKSVKEKRALFESIERTLQTQFGASTEQRVCSSLRRSSDAVVLHLPGLLEINAPQRDVRLGFWCDNWCPKWRATTPPPPATK